MSGLGPRGRAIRMRVCSCERLRDVLVAWSSPSYGLSGRQFDLTRAWTCPAAGAVHPLPKEG
jgi:hypothetical protein